MHTRAITPSIGVAIGRQMRLFHAFVTTAPAVLELWQRLRKPSTGDDRS